MNYAEYLQNNKHYNFIPVSCCKKDVKEHCPKEDAYQDGCTNKIIDGIKWFVKTLKVPAIIALVVQVNVYNFFIFKLGYSIFVQRNDCT